MLKPVMKSLVAAQLGTVALSGCAHLPGSAAEPLTETKVYRAPHVTVLPAKATAEVPSQDPNYVDHSVSNWTTPAAPAAKALTAAGAAKAQEPAYLEIKEVPTRAFRAYPVYDALETNVVDARFSPAIAAATWAVETHGSPIVGKVKLTLADDAGKASLTQELTPDELKLPSDLTGKDSLTLPLANAAVKAFLAKSPDVTHITVTAELEDAAGQPLPNKDGKPFQLTLPVDVM